MTQTECIRFFKSCRPDETNPSLLLNLNDTAQFFGLSPCEMREFIKAKGVPFYAPGKRKLYCVLEIMDHINDTKNKTTS